MKKYSTYLMIYMGLNNFLHLSYDLDLINYHPVSLSAQRWSGFKDTLHLLCLLQIIERS